MNKITIISSTVVSTVIVILGSMLIAARENAATVRSDDVFHQNEPALQQPTYSNDNQLHMLKDKIDSLLEKQQALVNRNFLLEKRISQLEDIYPQTFALSNDDTGQSQHSVKSATEVEEEEQELAGEELNLEFSNQASRIVYEGYDANWHAEMEASFNTIEQRLQEFNFTSTSITQSECGTQSCLVVYTHDKATDPTLISGLLAAQGASEVILKHDDQNGSNRTLALYKR